MFLRTCAPVALCLAAVLYAGCGGEQDSAPASDERAVRDTMRTYTSALAAGDGAKACDQLTSQARRQIVTQLSVTIPGLDGSSCEAALGDVAEKTGANAADQVCGPRDAECKRIAKQAGAKVVSGLDEVEMNVQVSGDSATAGAAAGPDGYEGQLRKIDGRWLISEFPSP